jgi:hypothetical protein
MLLSNTAPDQRGSYYNRKKSVGGALHKLFEKNLLLINQ